MFAIPTRKSRRGQKNTRMAAAVSAASAVGGGRKRRPHLTTTQQPPFRWGVAGSLLALAALLIAVALQWAGDWDALQRERNPPPRQSNAAQDEIPRGDDANPNAAYRLRSHDVVPVGQRHVINFSSIPIPMSSSQSHEGEADEAVVSTTGIACVSRDEAEQGGASSVAMSSCIPPYHLCTRVVVDHFITPETSDRIVRIMKNVLTRYGDGGGSGPVSLVDLNLGVVSMKDKFVSLFHQISTSSSSGKKSNPVPALTVEDVETYHLLVKKIHSYVSEMLFCDALPCASDRERELARRKGRELLFVAGPSFFSQIGASAADGAAKLQAKTVNDEYWHEHIDQDQYGSFAITTLLYLNTMKDDTALDTFQGGQFEFGDPLPGTVEPRKGRLSIFTSGREHPHWVAPVLEGYRYALTTAFTCITPQQARASNGGGGSAGVFAVDGQDDTTFLANVRKHLA
jgi:hypothetical protein